MPGDVYALCFPAFRGLWAAAFSLSPLQQAVFLVCPAPIVPVGRADFVLCSARSPSLFFCCIRLVLFRQGLAQSCGANRKAVLQSHVVYFSFYISMI
ncbi:hypothetical protein CNY67_00225 [Desulfovibrio sp. G11]|nr:hypothetical protein CNY67_00225 [Desulfovibrio sp. G11]